VNATGTGSLIVLQGGGPTAVVNASLFGVIDEATGKFSRVLGARSGVEGLIHGHLIEVEADERLRVTPGASLGSSRHRITENDVDRIVDVLRTNDARALIVIGGNGSLHGASMIAAAVNRSKLPTRVLGVPKTIDNDIAATDRCPGFGSAARYVAQSVRDLGMDVRTLPQPISIFETMGRNTGWLAGAAALAACDVANQDAPHLICLPEQPFDLDRFIADIDRVIRKSGWAIAVVAEGIKDASGTPVFESAAATQRDAMSRGLPGGVAAYLAEQVTQHLKIRCRSEKPGLCGRASIALVSQQDQRDAETVGRVSVQAALKGEHAKMVALPPLDDAHNEPGTELVSLTIACAGERVIPAKWLDDSDLRVSSEFLRYVKRIVGDLIEYAPPLKEGK
jgi:6-phosphofructokinase 1